MRDVLAREIEQALRLAREEGPLTDQKVHDLRRHLKRSRAALRLLRDAVTREAYASVNAMLRDASRVLAPARDAKILLDRLGEISVATGSNRSLSPLRRDLREKRDHQLGRLANGAPATVVLPLEAAAQRTARWRVPHDFWPIVESGLQRIYRKGRKALKNARAKRSDAALHEARKQVKYLEAALSILEPLKPRRLHKLGDKADAIATRLGDDHDMAVLSGVLRRSGGGNGALAEVTRLRRKWQKKALKRAGRLYERKPKAFTRAAVPRNSRRASALSPAT